PGLAHHPCRQLPDIAPYLARAGSGHWLCRLALPPRPSDRIAAHQGPRKGGTLVKRFSQTALIVMLTTAPILAGCATPPTAVSSHAPSGPAAGGTMSRSTAEGGVAGGSAMQGAARPNPKEFTAKTDLRDIRFEFDSYEIRTEDAQVLDQNADLMKA